tara:strand:- start:7286 stop:7525 length:240 start_codon:yes stop_codon:yes gene_type:complete
MKIYELHSYSVTDCRFNDTKDLSFSYHSSMKKVKERIKINGTEDADFQPIKHKITVLNLKNKTDVIKELNALADIYVQY